MSAVANAASRLVAIFLASGTAAGTTVVFLHAQRDRVAQLTEMLQVHQPVQELHLISHGSSGKVWFGNGELSLGTLAQHAALLQQWPAFLANDAELVLYGCHVALDPQVPGQTHPLIERLQALTGAQVAATVTPTGAAQRGGNWEMEAGTSHREAGLALMGSTQQAYAGVLASSDEPFTVTNTNSSGDGSLRSAILQANSNEGANTIIFDSSLSGDTISLTSGQLEITGPVTIKGLGAEEIAVDASDNTRVFYIDDGSFETSIEVKIRKLAISGGNSERGGGGILNNESLTLSNVKVYGNTTDSDGGGIVNGGTLNLINSTISGNSADLSGGGIDNQISTLNVTNSTISGNYAYYGGGGIDNTAQYGGGAERNAKVSLSNSTIAGNSAYYGGGGITNNLGTVSLSNSIIANNENADISKADDLDTINIKGINLVEDGSLTGKNVINQDPNLSPLQDNGGSTKTHALRSGSPAINAGDNSEIPPDTQDLNGDGDTGENIPYDQRGQDFGRLVNGNVDLGSYEFNASTSADISRGTLKKNLQRLYLSR